ncbi:hypothetical protein TVAG_027120 [Trichomonas vaginalis G3]|uniref:DUF3447 domain-containing protein n=1 Tax=Trichomonas vaginalis (strain ATCC PRA-98 / G3) TaxID=412133 RepID=A2F1F7_TRIV3|nr:ankyrin repeat and SOCS box-containing protein 4 family [Trichomonas vaginalis G3]EAY01244.1 hypothetical protein TVAG_027120 [Trichomonas vaginalis G3]KAI5486985.1 ankyrin repeat and SOCS box-containing protein 4 family [Trichomonas vaginalis G3]|eukprot:XP_001314059.1 hypothetical protein [Trichomonas vaginalis G3]
MEFCKDSRDSLKAFYKLHTHNQSKIDNIYDSIKTQIDSPEKLIEQIILASKYNLRYLKSYWAIFKKLFEEFHPKRVHNISPIFDYMVFEEYGFVFQEKSKNSFEQFDAKNYTLDVHEKYSIYKAIMRDDLSLFVSLTSRDDFDEDMKLRHDFYPKKNHEYGLLELCCYYGAVQCFKFMISKFEPDITPECLQFSFLSGKPDIMNECIKVQKPDKKCMKYAIISHNIDFVTFLMREHKINIDLNHCCKFNCIEAFCAYLVHRKDYITCFINSPKLFSVPLLKYLIRHVDNIDIKPARNKTALHNAIMNDFRSGVKLLVSKGASINEVNEDGNNYLHVASMLGFNELVKMFISYGIDVDSKGKKGCTSLHFTALNNLPDTAQILLQHGADIDIGDVEGKTPIHYSVRQSNKEICKFLLQHNADVNRKDIEGKTALHISAKNADTKFTNLLLAHGANINKRDKNGETPLFIAIQPYHDWYFLPAGSDDDDFQPNFRNQSKSLSQSKPLGQSKSVNKIKSKKFVEFLISRGADCNVKNKSGYAPIHDSTYNNIPEVIELLVSHGVDINCTNDEGNTSAHIASACCCMKSLEVLIKHGANVNIKNAKGITALHYASVEIFLEMVQLLIAHGADINANNQNKITPLACAISSKCEETAKYLRSLGATT